MMAWKARYVALDPIFFKSHNLETISNKFKMCVEKFQCEKQIDPLGGAVVELFFENCKCCS